MKAISPMVAVILLIAFTVAIGAILAVWFPGLIRTATGPTEVSVEKLAKCAPVFLLVEEVNETAGTVVISNPSALPLTSVKIVVDGIEAVTVGDLGAGEADRQTVYIGGNTTVVARGLCEKEVPREGKCSVGEPCWVS